MADGRAETLYFLSLLLLTVGTFLAAAALRWRRLDSLAAALGACGATAWLLSNGGREGAVLFEPLQGNGLTVADTLAVPDLILVGILCLRRLREVA